MTDISKPQADKFRDMARQLEADETPSAFEVAVRKVVVAPVSAKQAKPLPRRAQKAKPGEP